MKLKIKFEHEKEIPAPTNQKKTFQHGEVFADPPPLPPITRRCTTTATLAVVLLFVSFVVVMVAPAAAPRRGDDVDDGGTIAYDGADMPISSKFSNSRFGIILFCDYWGSKWWCRLLGVPAWWPWSCSPMMYDQNQVVSMRQRKKIRRIGCFGGDLR